MEQVILCAVWIMKNWLGSSLNVRESYSRALEQGSLLPVVTPWLNHPHKVKSVKLNVLFRVWSAVSPGREGPSCLRVRSRPALLPRLREATVSRRWSSSRRKIAQSEYFSDISPRQCSTNRDQVNPQDWQKAQAMTWTVAMKFAHCQTSSF